MLRVMCTSSVVPFHCHPQPFEQASYFIPEQAHPALQLHVSLEGRPQIFWTKPKQGVALWGKISSWVPWFYLLGVVRFRTAVVNKGQNLRLFSGCLGPLAVAKPLRLLYCASNKAAGPALMVWRGVSNSSECQTEPDFDKSCSIVGILRVPLWSLQALVVSSLGGSFRQWKLTTPTPPSSHATEQE